jgi:hypothetical protein
MANGLADILGWLQPGSQIPGMLPSQKPDHITTARRGLGDALMAIGAIGLGQDPFAVMQNQRQGRADAEQQEIENQRAAKQDARDDEVFGLQKERLGMEKAELEEKKAQRAQAQKIMLAFAGTPSMFGQQVGETMANLQAMGGLQPSMGGVHPANGRPIINNPDGSISTERSITVTAPQLNGGLPTNIPSLWDGQQLSEEQSVQRALQSGQQFPSFNGIDEAVAAAQARSGMLGQTQPQGVGGMLGGAQPQQGMGGILSNPNIDKTEAAGLTQLAQMGDVDVFWENLQKAVMSGPEQPKAPTTAAGGTMMWDGDSWEEIPGAADMRARVAAAGRSTTTINMPPMEKEFDKTLGKGLAEEQISLQKQGAAARNEAQQFKVLGDMLAQTYTGAGAQQVLQLKRVAGALGMDTEGVPEAQVAQKISRELALKLRNPESGGGMPGALSDADRNFLESMVPGIQNSSEGNRLMTEYMVRLANRRAEIATLAEQYADAHEGRLDRGWYKAQREYVEANPLFNDADFQNASALAQGGGGAGAAGGGSVELSDEELINKYK